MAICVSVMRKDCIWGKSHRYALGNYRSTPSTRHMAPRSICKADYDWVNPRSLRTMSASDDFDNLAENATCLINSIETTRSMVKFIV